MGQARPAPASPSVPLGDTPVAVVESLVVPDGVGPPELVGVAVRLSLAAAVPAADGASEQFWATVGYKACRVWLTADGVWARIGT